MVVSNGPQTIIHDNWIKRDEEKLLEKHGKLEANMEIKRPEELDKPIYVFFYMRAAAFYFSCIFLVMHFTRMVIK